jgi:hypothetical protein
VTAYDIVTIVEKCRPVTTGQAKLAHQSGVRVIPIGTPW